MTLVKPFLFRVSILGRWVASSCCTSNSGLMLPYILLNQAVLSPDFLESAARKPDQLRAPALLFLFGAVVTLAISNLRCWA